ncbi:MAG: VWA domain-containing protein, partial [Eggerthellaceae bacterium]|nr:VWA domain-containing protein [Eggerthellaceae bacterium]
TNIDVVVVAEAFFSHEAYSTEEYINKVILYQAGNQDLVKDIKRAPASAYSIHPNQKGAQAYADCVQAMIDQIEAAKANGSDFGKYYDSQTISLKDDAERGIALTLDVSGSMDGDPLKQTKIAALKFIESTVTDNACANASISLVSYSDAANLEYDSAIEASVADMSWWDLAWAGEDEKNAYRGSHYALRRKIRNLNSDGGTNIEDGLRLSYEQVMNSSADRRIIVLMSDGEATDGKMGDELVEYAQSIKDKGVLIYTLGFYQSTSEGAGVLERIASDGCYYQIDDANQLRYFFGDVADALNGTKFMYVRIACPVDVRVATSTGTLDSSSASLNTRSDFGSLTFAYLDGESEDPVKVLRLKEGQSYVIEIAGTGTGTMDYTIGFVDQQGSYSDMRSFENVSISPKTRAAAVAETGDLSVLRVDNDGDGNYDDIYQATANSAAQKVDNMRIVQIVTGGACLLVVLIALLYGLYCKKTWRIGARRTI